MNKDDLNNIYITITKDNKVFLIYKIGKGINYLHNIGVINRNITAFSILIHSTCLFYFIPKIYDFRYSLLFEINEYEIGSYGNKSFMSP